MDNKVTFGTLQQDGTLTNVRVMEQSVFGNCPFTIFLPEHYRTGGTCKCSNAEHRKLMIKDWGYGKKDFRDIPIID